MYFMCFGSTIVTEMCALRLPFHYHTIRRPLLSISSHVCTQSHLGSTFEKIALFDIPC